MLHIDDIVYNKDAFRDGRVHACRVTYKDKHSFWCTDEEGSPVSINFKKKDIGTSIFLTYDEAKEFNI